jgi:hypothetical protein
LVPFWAEKLVHTVLEAVVLGYTRNIVFPRRAAKQSLTSMFFSALSGPSSADDPPAPPTPPPAATIAAKQPEKSGASGFAFISAVRWNDCNVMYVCM